MSGSKQIANLRDQLTALENTPLPQTLTEANPITQGIANALRFGANLFKSEPKLMAGAETVLSQGGKGVRYKFNGRYWEKEVDVGRGGAKRWEAVDPAATAEIAAAEQEALKQAGNVKKGLVGKTFDDAWADPEIKRKIITGGMDMSTKMPWVFVRIGSAALFGVNLVDVLRAVQNHDSEKFWSSGGETIYRALGMFFPKTEIGIQIAMWTFQYAYEKFKKEKFTAEEEKFVREEAKKLYLAGTPPDPTKIDEKYFDRIKNDYDRWQKEKPVRPGDAGPSGAPAPTPAAASASTPAQAPASTPAQAPTATSPTSANDAEELRAMLKAAGLDR